MVAHLNQDRLDAESRYKTALEEQKQTSASRETMLISFFAILMVVGTGLVIMTMRGFARFNRKPGGRKSDGSSPGRPEVIHNTRDPHGELAEYVLDGRDEDGIRYLLRIGGDKMSGDDGVIIGRNPRDSPYVINHADVSRKHARMKVIKNRVFIEDLGSTNGTAVNGQTIAEQGPVSVTSGDQIIIGSVLMKLRVLNEKSA